MEKQFIVDVRGNRTGVILSMEEYDALVKTHQTSLASMDIARIQLDHHIEFYAVEGNWEKFKAAFMKRLGFGDQ